MQEYDVIFIGCGFGAICTIAKFNKLGLKSHIYERNWRSGGVWSENAYPGARVDSDAPIYQMFDKGVWEGFDFVDRYPGRKELGRYFDHVDKQLQFGKDTTYNANCTGALWDEDEKKWTVELEIKGEKVKAKCTWFIPAIGFAAKGYVPNIPGKDKFKGEIHHSAYWPEKGIELEGKKVAVIGTGASGVQIIQEVAPIASNLVVYQRTPNMTLPMRQKPIAADVNTADKASGSFDEAFKMTLSTFAGFAWTFRDANTFDDTPEEREKFYQSLMDDGGFKFWLATYKDTYADEKANLEAYKFWRKTVLKRLPDSMSHEKKEMLAPEEPPHPFGTKRPSLEQRYYETFARDNVELIDISADPIEEITETGIRTKSGTNHQFDVIALATGFDAVTGSLAQLNIRNAKGETISDHWKDGLRTSCGIAMTGLPNLFFLYGPQAPTAFSNGPSTVQVQAKFLDDLFKIILDKKIERIEPTQESESDWTTETNKYWDASLFPRAKSWYNGANIPGKRIECLNFTGGMPRYIEALEDSLKDNLHSWEFATAQTAH